MADIASGADEPTPETGFAVGDTLLAYYLSLPRNAGAGIPLRSDINPACLKKILPHIHISEWQPPDHLIVRLRGTVLDGQFQDPKEGGNMLDVVHGDDRANYCLALGRVFSLPCAAVFYRRMPDEFGQTLPFHMLALPLADSMGEPRFMVGASAIEGVPVWTFMEKAPFTVTDARLDAVHYIDIGSGIPTPEDDS